MGGIYDDQNYKNLMNANYYPLENMKKSVARLKASKQIDIETMEYGQYQPILSPLDTWPNGSGKVWFRALGHARLQLTAQPNTTPLSNDERVVVPPTKCALLDASIRKCFNSEPPIPMKADIRQHQQDDANSDQHEIRLVWEYGNGEDKAPTLLNLTMVCPYTTKSRKAEASAEARQEHSER
ncbi:hypothetical protein [Bradyrhizobium sp. AT1]|uniref:hypothetical protein n=1 Tax=Bradyrhizobium sp. AT1 TaxID=574934 RepID=UPI0007AC158C|nr:hypothetical protein [Bradyrhizobium sp. AT1]